MTASLAAAAAKIDVPPIPGISARAVRQVLAGMARIAQSDGTMRYGLRGAKVAELVDYSLSVVRRAQRWLVEHGYVEKVAVGGGRRSTKWRICVEKFVPAPAEPRHSSPPAEAPQQQPTDTAQKRRWVPRRISSRGPAGMSPHVEQVCKHGGDASLLAASGLPRCPSCRREVLKT